MLPEYSHLLAVGLGKLFHSGPHKFFSLHALHRFRYLLNDIDNVLILFLLYSNKFSITLLSFCSSIGCNNNVGFVRGVVLHVRMQLGWWLHPAYVHTHTCMVRACYTDIAITWYRIGSMPLTVPKSYLDPWETDLRRKIHHIASPQTTYPNLLGNQVAFHARWSIAGYRDATKYHLHHSHWTQSPRLC